MTYTAHEISLLKQIVLQTESGQYAFATPASVYNLQLAGLVEGNSAVVHGDNPAAIAFRATALAKAAIEAAENATPPAPQPAVVVPAVPVEPAPFAAAAPTAFPPFNVAPAVPVAPAAPVAAPAAPAGFAPTVPVVDGGWQMIQGFKLPEKVVRRAPGSKSYPFDTLELGASFFVPNTPERKDAKKTVGSTVSSANARFKDFSPRRYFKVVRVAEGQICGDFVAPAAGAVVVRTDEPPVAVEAQPAAE